MEKFNDPFDEVFIELYGKNRKYLLKYLYLFVHDLDVAEDLAQVIFLRIYKSRNIEITGDKFRNYIKKAARNIAIDHLRKTAREDVKNREVISDYVELNENFYLSLENSVIDGEILSTVHDVLENFSQKNRKIFISRIMDNKTRKQVSEEENLSAYAVKKIEFEILQKLREKLKQYF